jgi:hypothetical protein
MRAMRFCRQPTNTNDLLNPTRKLVWDQNNKKLCTNTSSSAQAEVPTKKSEPDNNYLIDYENSGSPGVTVPRL